MNLGLGTSNQTSTEGGREGVHLRLLFGRVDAHNDGMGDMGHGRDSGGPDILCHGYWQSVRLGVAMCGVRVHTQTLAGW